MTSIPLARCLACQTYFGKTSESPGANPGASTRPLGFTPHRLAFFRSTVTASVTAFLRGVSDVRSGRLLWRAVWQPAPAPLHIRCGCSDPDPVVEAKIVAARTAANPALGFDGCGRLMVVWQSFRCTECGRWLHRDCALKHFASHRTGERS